MRPCSIALAALLCATACGGEDDATPGSTAVSTSGFDKGCSADGDCVGVYEGNACNACKCENATIARSAEASYARELDFAEGRCSNVPACAADCAAAIVACESGTCVVK